MTPRPAPQRPLAVATLLVLLGTGLPFLGQALHIDDQIYLMGADIIAQDPLRPLSPRRGFLGREVRFFEGVNSHPAGLPYYLAAARALTGARSEAALHALMLPFALLLVLGCRGLARELGLAPGWPGLLLISAAPTVVMGHTLMTDLSFVALFLCGLWTLLRGLREAGWAGRRWTLLAALFCNLAWFFQYRGLLLLPAAGAFMLARRRLPPPRALLALASVPLALGGWCLWNRWEVGQTHLFWSGGQIEYTGGRLLTSAVTLLTYTGGTLAPLALPALWALWRRHRRLLWVALGAPVLAAPATLWIDAPLGGPGLQWGAAALAWLGGVTVVSCLGLAWTAPAPPGEQGSTACGAPACGRLLALLGGGLLAAQGVASLFASVRMLLLPLPFLLLALMVGLRRHSGPVRQKLLVAVLCGNLLLGLLISAADSSYAGAYRDLAPRVAGLLGAPARGRGFFVGEWGLRAYLEAQGFTYLTGKDTSPRPGDLVVIPGLNCPWSIHPGLRRRLGPPQRLEVPGAFPLRTMDPRLGAGFYSDGYGPLPLAPAATDRPYDVLQIFPVVR